MILKEELIIEEIRNISGNSRKWEKNVWDLEKALLRGKLTEEVPTVSKKRGKVLNNLTVHLRVLNNPTMQLEK